MDATAKEIIENEDEVRNCSPCTDTPSPISIIEVVDYAELRENEIKKATEESNVKPKKRRLRRFFSVFNAVIALLLIVYRLIPVFSTAAVTATYADIVLLATFGKLASTDASADTDTDGDSVSGKLSPLSHSIGDSAPLGTFDDEMLRQILYSSSSPECDEDEYPIKPADLSVDAENGLYASNETAYEIDLSSYLSVDLDFDSVDTLTARYGAEAPVVLIVHTHGTEAYAEDGVDTYSKKDNCRTSDTSKNVVAVGAVMAEYFNSVGIPTLHCTEMFDADSYIDAYDKSSAAIREFTAIYPSIRYVFDVHRDSVINSDMTKLRPVTVIDGEMTAQYMCVIGTDERAGYHTEWERNLAFACQLQARLWQKSNSLVRRMSIRSASYNQLWAPGSLLLEIGSCGNTLSEAKACAKTVAEQISAIILEQ